MKILYISSHADTEGIIPNMQQLGYQVESYKCSVNNTVIQDTEVSQLIHYIEKKNITHLFSVGFNYNIAIAAQETDRKYVCMVWDAPYLLLYSELAKNNHCFFSVFDKLDAERFRKAGVSNILYQPLAVDKYAIQKWEKSGYLTGSYREEISFVGRLYEKNAYDMRIREFPEEIIPYFTSIMEEAAFKWDGINRIYGKVSNEILQYIQVRNPNFLLGNPFPISDTYFFEVMFLARKLANIERICILNLLAESYDIGFYTDPNEMHYGLEHVRIMPPVMAGEESARVFAGSKINLNISIKGIEGGTPQRVMDIMGAGGFALTNYAEETLELFEEGKEIVTYKSPEELLDKACYYMRNDTLREHIARAGQNKVLNEYTYDRKLKELFDWVDSGV
ncbi:MAG: glycosyltransferase [Lachnospiraceae bacterium]